MKIYKIIFFFSFIFLILNCGRKGSPLPPISKKPMYINSIKLKQLGKKIIVLWKYTPKYDDNRPLKKFSFKIYLNDKVISPKIYTKNNIYWFEHKISNFKKEYCFNIKVITEKEESDNSPIECIIPSRNIPEKPKILKIDLKENGLLIKWKTDNIVINIYRDNEKNIVPIPYKKVKNKLEFLDTNLTFNKVYCYFLTAEDNEVESQKSNIVCKEFKDIFPPKPPSDFKILKKGKNYYLIWKESPSKDVIGYIIYKNGKPLFKIPIKTYFFIDKNYKNGDSYYIIAIDRAGNKSKKVYLKEIIK